MKQHITVEQLNELSEKGKEKLREWFQNKRVQLGDKYVVEHEWKNEEGEKVVTWCEHRQRALKNMGVIYTIRYEDLPLLSIGQMIEFLVEAWGNDPDNMVIQGWLDGQWTVDKAFEDKPVFKERFEAGELCDALWEAVKEVLEQDA